MEVETQRLALKKRQVSTIKRQVLVERVVAAQRLVADLAEKLESHMCRLEAEALPLNGPEAIAMAAKVTNHLQSIN